MKNLTTTSTLLSTLFIVAAATGFAGSALAEDCANAYDSSQAYTQGDVVSVDGFNWTAAHWTQNQTPGTGGEWGPWRNSAACVEGAVADVSESASSSQEQTTANDSQSASISGGEATELNADETQCLSSEDIAADNETIREEAHAAGVASVDITTDNETIWEEAHAAGVASVDITTDNETIWEEAHAAGVASVTTNDDSFTVDNQCAKLAAPAHGRTTFTDAGIMSTQKFTCDEGYKLEGRSTLSCVPRILNEDTVKFVWNRERPSCVTCRTECSWSTFHQRQTCFQVCS